MKRFLILFLLLFSCGLSGFSQINIDYWMNSGQEKLMDNKYLSAIEDFNFIIRFNPDLNDAYYFRGVAKYYLGDYRGSIDDLTTAIQTKPYTSGLYTKFFLFRGFARKKLMDFGGALEDYTKAIEINPGNFDAYLNRGLMYIILKKYDKAVDDFNRVILYNPKSTPAYLYRAIAYHLAGDQKSSIADFDRTIRLEPGDPETFLRRGAVRLNSKDYFGAIEDYSRVIRIDSTSTLAYFNRALAEIETLEYNSAMMDLNKVVELDPRNDISFYNRALLKSRVGDYKGAIADYTMVISLTPSNVLPYFNRGNLWQLLKNYRKAIEDYSAAIKLYPDFAVAYFNRSLAKQSINDLRGAARDNEMASQLNANSEQLKNSGSIDSTGLARLEEFRASFDPVDRTAEISPDFTPAGIYYLTYAIADSADNSSTTDRNSIESIRNLNASSQPGKFLIVSENSSSREDQLPDQISKSAFNDSIGRIFAHAILKKKQQDYNGSIEEYSRIIRLKPDFSLAYFNRAGTRYEALSLLNAVREYNSQASIDQDNPGITSKKIVRVNYDEVISDYQKSIELDPRFCYGYFNLANVKTMQKEFMPAIINYTKAIQTSPGFAEAYYNRGLLYLYLHHTEAGCSDLSKAGEYGFKKAYDTIKTFCYK